MAKEWLFEDEVVKTKNLYAGQRDPTYDPTKFVAPENVDLAYFPYLKRGRVLTSSEEANNLLEQLLALPKLTTPNISMEMWQVKL